MLVEQELRSICEAQGNRQGNRQEERQRIVRVPDGHETTAGTSLMVAWLSSTWNDDIDNHPMLCETMMDINHLCLAFPRCMNEHEFGQ